MGRKKVIVDREVLKTAVLSNVSMQRAAKSIGLAYSTFMRRCVEFGIELKPNPSGRGLTAKQRYGEEKAKELSIFLSNFLPTRTCSDKTREVLRSRALERIDKGLMPSKGLKGRYHEIWFDSSWELAYYIWMLEANNIQIKRNTTIWFDYPDDNGILRRTKPDFQLPCGKLVEIKGYPNIHTKAKYKATCEQVEYLFREDLNEALSYVREKYGNRFTEVLYASVAKLVYATV